MTRFYGVTEVCASHNWNLVLARSNRMTGHISFFLYQLCRMNFLFVLFLNRRNRTDILVPSTAALEYGVHWVFRNHHMQSHGQQAHSPCTILCWSCVTLRRGAVLPTALWKSFCCTHSSTCDLPKHWVSSSLGPRCLPVFAHSHYFSFSGRCWMFGDVPKWRSCVL